MNTFDQNAFNQFILSNKIIGFFEKPITLKSGRQSCWYVNWRRVAEDAFLLHQLTEFVLSFVEQLIKSRSLQTEPICMYGVPEGATKLGILAQYFWAKSRPNFGLGSHPMPMGRGKPKEHGDPRDKFFVGIPRGDTLVLEDVTTTGGSLLTTIDALNESGIPIVGALGLTNRMELRDDGKTVKQAIAEKTSNEISIPYFHMSSAKELLPLALQQQKPADAIHKGVMEEFEKLTG